MAKLAVGDKAPAFTLKDQHGKPVRLSSSRARASSCTSIRRPTRPGCTTQSCNLRDAFPQLKKLKAAVLGISPDPRREAEEVRRQVRARLPAARRRGPHGRRGVGRVGREVDLRPEVHGHRPLGVRRRREGQARRRLLQGQPEGHKHACSQDPDWRLSRITQVRTRPTTPGSCRSYGVR